jgi:hypothetical protein
VVAYLGATFRSGRKGEKFQCKHKCAHEDNLCRISRLLQIGNQISFKTEINVILVSL